MSFKTGVPVLLTIGLLAMAPTAGIAQERVPHTGSTAVGFDGGGFVPVG